MLKTTLSKELNSRREKEALTLQDLYSFANKKRIDICEFAMKRAESLVIQDSGDGPPSIAIDPDKSPTMCDVKVKIAHELGHCETGSFYNRYSHLDVRRKHENRADRWAIKKLIPEDELKKAVSSGVVETWELAEYFSVTEPFMIKAILYYKEIK